MKVFSDDSSWYIAEDLEDLRKLLVDEEKILGPEFDDIEWYEEKPEVSFSIIRDPSIPREDWIRDRKTFAEWIEHNGRGFLASHEW